MRVLFATLSLLACVSEARCDSILVNPGPNFDITCTGQNIGTTVDVDAGGYYIVQIWERIGNSGDDWSNVASNGATLTAGTHTITVQLPTYSQGYSVTAKATLSRYTMPGTTVRDSNPGTLRGP